MILLKKVLIHIYLLVDWGSHFRDLMMAQNASTLALIEVGREHETEVF